MRISPLILSALLVTAAFSAASAQAPRPGQAPPPGKPQQGPPPIAPAGPYKPVAVTPPAALNDPAFEALRKQIGEAAQKKDRAGLAKLVVAQGFFWEGEKGDKAAKNKSGIDNLSAAIGLGPKPGPGGWEMLMGYASDPTAMPDPRRNGVVCAPADPAFDAKEFEAVFKATKTEPDEWGYPVKDGVEVRQGPQPTDPVVEKLGLHLVRVIPDMPPPGPPGRNAPPPPPPPQNQVPAMKIVTPSGKTGFIPADALAPLGNDQLCYVKDATGWKIGGYIGGD